MITAWFQRNLGSAAVVRHCIPTDKTPLFWLSSHQRNRSWGFLLPNSGFSSAYNLVGRRCHGEGGPSTPETSSYVPWGCNFRSFVSAVGFFSCLKDSPLEERSLSFMQLGSTKHLAFMGPSSKTIWQKSKEIVLTRVRFLHRWRPYKKERERIQLFMLLLRLLLPLHWSLDSNLLRARISLPSRNSLKHNSRSQGCAIQINNSNNLILKSNAKGC